MHLSLNAPLFQGIYVVFRTPCQLNVVSTGPYTLRH